MIKEGFGSFIIGIYGKDREKARKRRVWREVKGYLRREGKGEARGWR